MQIDMYVPATQYSLISPEGEISLVWNEIKIPRVNSVHYIFIVANNQEEFTR